jgi:hypothetical protein
MSDDVRLLGDDDDDDGGGGGDNACASTCRHIDDLSRLSCALACGGRTTAWSSALVLAMVAARRAQYALSANEVERMLRREVCWQRHSGTQVSLSAVQTVLQQGARFHLFRLHARSLRYAPADLAGAIARWQPLLDAADAATDASARAQHLRLAMRRFTRSCPGALPFHDTPTVHAFFVQCEELLGVAEQASELPFAVVRHEPCADSDDSDTSEEAEEARRSGGAPPVLDHTLDSLDSIDDAFSEDSLEEDEFVPVQKRRRTFRAR